MANFMAWNHGWHEGGQLTPSPSLQVDFVDQQRGLLNLTTRDIKIGTILDQCMGKKKVIAKRRKKIVSGNVNSYAQILNKLQQLEWIQTFNDH